MRNLIISYDLRNSRNYELMQMGIDSLGRNEKVLESCHFVKSTYTAIQARDLLKRHIDKDDGVVVFDCSENTWATCGAKSTKLLKAVWNN